VALCITNCFIAVVLASYVKQASQGAALLVATGAAVANTRRHLVYINQCFVNAIACFMASAGLLIWLYVGLAARIPYVAPKQSSIDAASSPDADESIVTLYDGSQSIACIDVRVPAHNDARNLQMQCIAWTNTFIIVGMGALGYWRFRSVRNSYDPEALMAWYTEYKTKQHEMHEKIRKGRGKGKMGKLKEEDFAYHYYHDSEPDSTGDAEP